MSKPTFTPGPWIASGDTVFASTPEFKSERGITSGFRCMICTLDTSDGIPDKEMREFSDQYADEDEDELGDLIDTFAQERAEANAQLIANAPDLLDGLIELLDVYEDGSRQCYCVGEKDESGKVVDPHPADPCPPCKVRAVIISAGGVPPNE